MSTGYLSDLCSFKGRMNRATFLLMIFILLPLAYIVCTYIVKGLEFFLPLAVTVPISVLIALVFFLCNISAVMRRIHDIDLSSWWITPYIICFAGFSIFSLLFLFFNIYLFKTTNTDQVIVAQEYATTVLKNWFSSLPFLSLYILYCYNSIISLLLTFFLFFKKGTNGANRFGPDSIPKLPVKKWEDK